MLAASGQTSIVDGRFKGGWITRAFGRPSEGVDALQLELACRAYMHEPDHPTPQNWPTPIDEKRAEFYACDDQARAGGDAQMGTDMKRDAPYSTVCCHSRRIADPTGNPSLTELGPAQMLDSRSTAFAVVGNDKGEASPMTAPARLDNMRVIRSPRGTELTAKSWLTEAPLRMLMNNLDPDVAERPGELVVYGGIGRAARDWPSFDRIVATLQRLEGDQTLLVQSGKPVGVFRTQADAPRVLIANSNLVPHWATWDCFNELDRKGLMMYGQMTAGSWIYIGSQGIVQGTYETFVEMGRQHYGGDLRGRWILSLPGLGGMGGAQPLAASMAGASLLAIECRPSSIEFRLRTGYIDVQAKDLDDALAIIERSTKERKAVSVALLGNAGEVLPELLRRGVRPDIVTDQTSAHDPINGRQQHSTDGAGGRRQGRLRLPRLCAGLYPPAVLPWRRAFSVGGAIGRSGGYLQDRRQGQRAHAGQPGFAQLARHGARAHQVSGPAGSHLLGGPGRPASAWPRLQRNGRVWRTQGANRHRPRPSRFRLGGVA